MVDLSIEHIIQLSPSTAANGLWSQPFSTKRRLTNSDTDSPANIFRLLLDLFHSSQAAELDKPRSSLHFLMNSFLMVEYSLALYSHGAADPPWLDTCGCGFTLLTSGRSFFTFVFFLGWALVAGLVFTSPWSVSSVSSALADAMFFLYWAAWGNGVGTAFSFWAFSVLRT